MTESRLRKSVKACEKQLIQNAYADAGFDVAKTAKFLGIGLSTLYRKFVEYKIDNK